MTPVELRMAMCAATIVKVHGAEAVIIGIEESGQPDGTMRVDKLTANCVERIDGQWRSYPAGRLENVNPDDVVALGDECGERLECGGCCFKLRGHEPPHLCSGDEDGEPGSCPA